MTALAEQLLDRDQVASWCADHDPTGRYVCARIRNHPLDWHAGRNDAGGIHQWPAAVASPAPDPVVYGLAPNDMHHDDVLTAKALWEAIKPQFDPNDAWEYTELGPLLRTFVAVLDRRRAEIGADVGLGDLRQLIVAELDGMVTEFIHPNSFGGYDIDHGRFADIALAVVQPELERQAAELARLRNAIAEVTGQSPDAAAGALVEGLERLIKTATGAYLRVAKAIGDVPAGEASERTAERVRQLHAELANLRASREAWAIEATSQDGLADRFLGWYSRVHDAVSQAAKLPPGQTVDDVVEAVGRLGRERDAAVVALAADRIVYCNRPEDRLWHASDRTWWRRGEDGRLVRADAPPWFAAGPVDLRLAMIRAIADQLARIAASEDMPHRQEIQDAADALAGRVGAPGSPWDQWLAPAQPVEAAPAEAAAPQ